MEPDGLLAQCHSGNFKLLFWKKKKDGGHIYKFVDSRIE